MVEIVVVDFGCFRTEAKCEIKFWNSEVQMVKEGCHPEPVEGCAQRPVRYALRLGH
jgi:hypothetical protein